MCSCDGEPADVYRETSRKARKQHRCRECSATIPPGHGYTRAFVAWAAALRLATMESRIQAIVDDVAEELRERRSYGMGPGPAGRAFAAVPTSTLKHLERACRAAIVADEDGVE